MSVAKMRLVSIIGHMDSLNAVVFACGQSGVFQPDDAMTFFSDTSHFVTVREENPYSAPLSRLEAAAARVKGDLSKSVPPSTMEEADVLAYVESFTNSRAVTELSRRLNELNTRLESENKDIEQYEHFRGLDIDLNRILNCETIKVRFGRLPKDSFEKLKSYNENPYVLFFPGASDSEYYWGVYFAPIEFAADVDRIFSSLYFERLRLPAAAGTAEEIVERLKREQAQTAAELEQVKQELADFWKKEQTLCLQVYARLKQLSQFFDVRKFAACYNDKFILAGWIPAREERAFRKALDGIPATEYSIEQAGADTHHTPPVTLRNPRVFRPFEFFVDMYGLPRYNEVDPTAFVAITFTVLFGIMFGDLGQGILLSVIGWLLWRFKKMAIGRILLPCGISSAVFGLVYGSVFGFEHVLDPLYKAVFGLSEKPVEVMNSDTTTMLILLAVVIGFFLILAAMLLNIYSSLKQRNYERAIFGENGVAGFVFYASLIIGCVLQLALGIPVMNAAYVIFLIVLPLVLIFLREPLGKLAAGEKDWKPEKWGEFIVQNLFEMFEIMLSYVSNTVSFLRVAAFVLVHAGMMMAVFAIAGMFQTVGYIVAVVIGNALVMVMEAMLVSIQVMRLEFYEMFSRYYNGDGRAFQPLAVSAGTHKN